MSLNDQPEVQTEEQATVPSIESLDKHMKALIYGGAAVIAVVVGIIVVNSAGGVASEAGWSSFAEASSASDFANVASDFPGTEVAVWARLREAEMQLGEGIQLQLTDRAAADSLLDKASDAFGSVIENGAAPANAKERALLGKARLLEATSDGDLSEAITAYKAFADGFPESVWAAQVAERIKSLESDDAAEFYAWFSQQNPKPEDRPTPQDGLPAGHPEIPVSLPPIPNELVPADWSEIDLGGAAASGDTAGTAADGKAAADGGASSEATSGTNSTEAAPSETSPPETEKPNQE